ncbi:hypothetical protein ACFLU6_12210 [Acidobacteriota bacterium]
MRLRNVFLLSVVLVFAVCSSIHAQNRCSIEFVGYVWNGPDLTLQARVYNDVGYTLYGCVCQAVYQGTASTPPYTCPTWCKDDETYRTIPVNGSILVDITCDMTGYNCAWYYIGFWDECGPSGAIEYCYYEVDCTSYP